MIGLATAALWGGQAAPLAASPPTPVAVAVAAPAPRPEQTGPVEPPEPIKPVAAASPRPMEPERARIFQAVRRHLGRVASRTGLTHLEIDALAEVVVDESQRHRLAPELVLAIMQVESGYRNYAVSEKDAMGLMQILPSTGRWLAPQIGLEWKGPQTLFDPIANVRLGVAYLRQLWDRYDNLSAALAAYNWGPGRIDRRIAAGGPIPVEYPNLVLAALARQSRPS
jgi:soluble lytic murein transglycosylase-like protein